MYEDGAKMSVGAMKAAQQQATVKPEKHAVPISGVWIRTLKDYEVQVLVEVSGEWYLVFREPYDGEGAISHIMEVGGLTNILGHGPDRQLDIPAVPE